MTALRVFTWLWAPAGTLALVGAVVACTLNPQPLPPYAPSGAGGSEEDAASNVSFGPEGGTETPVTGTGDASSANTNGDASTTAEAGGSSLDGGVPASLDGAATDATDETDAIDATTDAPTDATEAASWETE